ncbi:MAG: preprotein translocase subunit SecA, partial [Lactobacillus crispatus]|nr:preprotein translocase subunit SecA [Lactobacillus crispatus]
MKLRNLIENNKFKRKKLEKIVKRVESFQDYYASLSDDQLKNSTDLFRQRLQNGETLIDILPEAYAAIREADKRVLGLFPYPVQIMG